MATQSYLPPSSLLLWQKVLADVDAVYLGDFDSEFTNEQFWDHNDDGLIDWSATQVARAATILAEALHSLAGGSSAATPLQIDTQACSSLLICQSAYCRLCVRLVGYCLVGFT